MAKRRTKQFLEEFQPPGKKLVSDGGLLIKELSKRQCNTKISLAGQLAHEKIFEKGNEFLPITSYQSGECSIHRIKKAEEFIAEIEDLKAAGLCDEDIHLYSVYQGDFNRLVLKHPFYETQLLKDRIEKIEDMITNYKEKHKNPRVQTPSIVKDNFQEKPESIETKLLQFARQNYKPTEALPHPMDELNDIKSDLETRLALSDVPIMIKNVRKKARKLANRFRGPINSNVTCEDTVSTQSMNNTNVTKWDVKVATFTSPHIPLITEKKSYTCQQQLKYTIKDGEIVRLDNLINSIEYNGDRMSISDITSMPKFNGYSEGIASNVLYLKNLPNKVAEKDLRKIFEKYGNIDSGVAIKILTGRMRGQAFITFSGKNEARINLDKLNGLLIDGKPMIIQFGKRSTHV